MPRSPLNRRTFLRSAGVCIGLPLLDAMLPAGLRGRAEGRGPAPEADAAHRPPAGPARAALLPGRRRARTTSPRRYLKPLQDHRRDFTVFSGMSHRGYPGGHHTEVALLTGVAPEGVRFGDIRNTISLDQEVAARLGGETRFASLALGGGRPVVEPQGREAAVGGPGHRRSSSNCSSTARRRKWPAQVERIETAESILDGVRDQARSLGRTLGPADRERLDLLLTSIREAEQRLQQDQAWVTKPKPKVEVQAAHRRLPQRPADAGPRTAVVRPGPSGPANRFDARDRPVALVARPGGPAGVVDRPSRRDAPRPGRVQAQAARRRSKRPR